MFERIEFFREKDREEFEKYRKLKGTALFDHIYSLLTESGEIVKYGYFNSHIRYDKHLREKLYNYMATVEEYFRAQILERFDIAIPKKYRSHCFEQLKEDLIPRSGDRSVLYYGFQPDFGDLMHICAEKEICDISSSDQKAIKDLRNDTMHHSLIMFGVAKTKAELLEHFSVLERQLNAFCRALPQEYQKGFLSDMEALNATGDRNRKHLDKYYLEVQDGTIRIKT